MGDSERIIVHIQEKEKEKAKGTEELVSPNLTMSKWCVGKLYLHCGSGVPVGTY